MSDDIRVVWSPVEEDAILVVPSRAALDAQIDRAAPTTVVDCPFCPGGAEYSPSAGNHARGVVSKHPMVGHAPTGGPNHYVIVYGDAHEQRLADVEFDVALSFFRVIASLSDELYANVGVEAVYAFESVGDHFGPTVAHPHGQVLGLPFVPRRLVLAGENCAICTSSLKPDLTVVRDENASLRVPPWSRLPYEMVVAPHRHVARLSDLQGNELASIARLSCEALRLAAASFGSIPPYILSVMQSPRDAGDAQHLRVEIVPLHRGPGVLKRPGAMELGLGVYINPLEAAKAAASLRALVGA